MEETRLRERIKELIDASGLTQQAIADKMGLTGGHLSKILSGADGRTVKLSHLVGIADALGKPITAFFDKSVRVPIIGEVDAFGGPPTSAIDAETDNYAELFSENVMDDCYRIQVKDRSMLPSYLPGTWLTARKESFDQIKNNNLVIYRGGEQILVRIITLTPENIILRGVNPSVEEMVLPRIHLKLCDKIVTIHPA
jgi:transcriptional regulator with XRE-family HTH domain